VEHSDWHIIITILRAELQYVLPLVRWCNLLKPSEFTTTCASIDKLVGGGVACPSPVTSGLGVLFHLVLVLLVNACPTLSAPRLAHACVQSSSRELSVSLARRGDLGWICLFTAHFVFVLKRRADRCSRRRNQVSKSGVLKVANKL
jgi:hypothetical protein